MTTYVVIRRSPGTDGYKEIGRASASSATGAIRHVINNGGVETSLVESGEYAAIPERNWRFSPVKIETERRVRIG